LSAYVRGRAMARPLVVLPRIHTGHTDFSEREDSANFARVWEIKLGYEVAHGESRGLRGRAVVRVGIPRLARNDKYGDTF
jgi:hypothetical protein